MGFSVNFTDNQNIYASDLSVISEDIDSAAGSVSFSDGTLYGIDELNNITKALITRGVSKGCSVTAVGLSVTINQGVAFFADGKKITVDSDGITLVRQEGETNYVWFCNDSVTGVVSARCTLNEPSGDFVRLAEITPDGTVLNKPNIACMKNPSLLPNLCERAEWMQNIVRGSRFEKEVPVGHSRAVLYGYERLYFIDFETGMVFYDKEKSIPLSSTTFFIGYEQNISDFTYADGKVSFITNGVHGSPLVRIDFV